MGVCALLVALGGSAYAAIVVTGRNIQDGTVAGIDLRNGSLTGRDVKSRSLRLADFRPGTLARGPRGRPGPAGPAFSTFDDGLRPLPDDPGVIGTLAIPATGSYFVIANATAFAPADPALVDCALVAADGDRVDADRQVLSAPLRFSNFTSTVVHTFERSGFVSLTCEDNGTDTALTFIKITAVPTGSLANEPF